MDLIGCELKLFRKIRNNQNFFNLLRMPFEMRNRGQQDLVQVTDTSEFASPHNY